MARTFHRLLLTALLLTVVQGCGELSEDTGRASAGALVQWNEADDTGFAPEVDGAGEEDSASIDFDHEDPPAPARVPDPRSPGLWRP